MPYRARRVAPGAAAIAGTGVLAGLVGASGGFLRTPVLSEVLHVPVKVAGATTLFGVGITCASGLLVFALQDGIVVAHAAAVVLGGLLGGLVGARLQRHLPPVVVRRALSALLLVLGVLLVAR